MNKFPTISFTIGFLMTIMLLACRDKPKVILADDEMISMEDTGAYRNSNSHQNGKTISSSSGNSRVHNVTVKKVLPSSKYVYLFVEESEEEFWIATLKQEVEIGGNYSYKGELLKTNFESKEFNRTFDSIYLVSKFIKINPRETRPEKIKSKDESAMMSTDINLQSGSITIAELVKEPKKYNGKTIQLSGVCTKVNANIMKRNWLHLKDGSKDDYDLVITTDFLVPVGHEITIKGTVVVGRDFGSGYYYDILIENGELVK